MLTSINPLGEVGRKQNWGLTVFSYMVGNVVGGFSGWPGPRLNWVIDS